LGSYEIIELWSGRARGRDSDEPPRPGAATT
jgi:hypothetical protein